MTIQFVIMQYITKWRKQTKHFDIFRHCYIPPFQRYKHFFSVPEVLKVIAALLKTSPPSPESMEVRRVFLSDMIKLFNNSRENRR